MQHGDGIKLRQINGPFWAGPLVAYVQTYSEPLNVPDNWMIRLYSKSILVHQCDYSEVRPARLNQASTLQRLVLVHSERMETTVIMKCQIERVSVGKEKLYLMRW